MTLDARFTVDLEYVGRTDRAYVARYCGERLGHADTAAEATSAAYDWNACRLRDRPWLRHGEPAI